jgi:uroporphyrinogen decarboxylase
VARVRLVTEKNVRTFPFPDPGDPSRYRHNPAALKAQNDGFFVVDLGWTLFERAWTLAGMAQVLEAMIVNKSFVHDLLDRITEWNLRIVDNICAFPIDAVWFGDDWGHQRGLLMGPKLWRESIKPRMKTLFERAKSKGKYVFIHSCGIIEELLPELIVLGLDVFNPFQPEVMDVFEVKKKYGSALSFWGGISTQRTLPRAACGSAGRGEEAYRTYRAWRRLHCRPRS